MRVSAVILAAGRGERMGAERNKVLLSLGGQSVLARTVAAFSAVDAVSEIVLVVRPGEEAFAAAEIPDGGPRLRVIAGGLRRVDSASAGVRAAEGEIVLIHDGARPLVSRELIERVIDGTVRYGACVPVVSVSDTLRRRSEAGDLLPEIVARDRLVGMQTPQGFRSALIRKALSAQESHSAWPDDAAAVFALGIPVSCVEGDPLNLKLTTPADLRLAERLLATGERQT
jgi:2-C-methyl-D-erythritol 4-phosphate cytidylyltransferase